MQQILIHIIPIYFAFYAFLSTCYRTRWHWSIKVTFCIILLIASQYAALSRAFYYGYDGLISHGVLVAFAWSFTVELFLILFCLAKDAVLAARFILKKNAFPYRAKLSIGTLVAAICVATLANYTALKQPPVTEQTIEIKNLPEAFDGYRIAQLSDIHTSALLGRDRNEKIVERTNALNADLIVITGDLVDGTLAARQDDLRPLGRLYAPDGVIAIEGNHEHYVAHDDWRRFFPSLGFRWLENEHVIIVKEGCALAIAGITDPMAKRYARQQPELDKALQGIASGVPTILLSHQVKNSPIHAQKPIALQLSGHTHGGQIFGAHWLAQGLNNGFVKGLYQIGDMQLYVNRGTSLWFGFPIRLGIDPEISLITLKKAP
ncbi:MAG: metallophosphoesterase [Burkholderiaceae bacterium]|nr:metallophosphoesterase [Burkholderiaceae bacterium]